MNKLKFIAAIFISIALFSCCDGSKTKGDTQLKKIVREINKECPVAMGEYMEMEGITYKEGAATLTYNLIDENLLDLEAIRANEEAFHNNMLVTYANNDDKSFRRLIKAIIDANATLNIVFNLPTDDSYSLTFTTEELKENMPGSESDPEKMLQKTIENTQLQIPLMVDEGMICTSVELDENYCTYCYDCDEELYDIELLYDSFTNSHEEMVQSLLEDMDPMFSRIARLLKKTNRGLKYKYVGATSGMEAILVIEHSEL